MNEDLKDFKKEVNNRFDKFEVRQDEFQKTALEQFGQINVTLHKMSEILVKQEAQEKTNEDQQQQLNRNTESIAEINLRLTTAIAVDSEREKRFNDKINDIDSIAKRFSTFAWQLLATIITIAVIGGLYANDTSSAQNQKVETTQNK